MHARRTLRGLAAALLSAALVSGGVLLAAPAGYAESLPDPDAVASQAVESQEAELDAPEPSDTASETGAGDSANGGLPSGEEVHEDAEDFSTDGESASLEPSDEAPVEAVEPQMPAAGPASQGITAAAPQAVSDVSLRVLDLEIVAKKSLTVPVEATGFDDTVGEIEAAVIEKDKEADLTTEGRYIAIAEPSPSVSSGETRFDLKIEFDSLDRTKQYEVLLWKQGEAPADPDNIYARVDLAVNTAQWDQLFGTAATPITEVGRLDWGVLERFRNYVEGPIAHGKIAVVKPASAAASKDSYSFPQVPGGKWNTTSEKGSVAYGGALRFTGHDGVLDLTLANPIVTVRSATEAELSVSYRSSDMGTGAWTEKRAVIAKINLSAAVRAERPSGAVRWTNAPATLTAGGVEVFQDFYAAGQQLDPLSFTVGADSKTAKPVDPPKTNPTETKPKPKPVQPKPLPPATTGTGAQAAGSLSWGISSAFASYVTGPIAKGEISTSGVGSSGGAYLFPQAAGGSWNAAAQTGSVQYSGVVTFTGHKGLLSETFSNPVITVANATSGTISSGGSSFGLDLASASKSVGPNGEVSWSGVPVLGGISGGASGGSQYTLPVDPLSFTVGTASTVSYGSTAVSNASLKRTAADTPPATTGIRVITPAEDIVPGGEIEFEAPGFEAKEREILVVLYSDPVVLDEAAGADENGTVRWIGTIPEDIEPGEHTITLQGSTNAGAVITVLDGKREKKAAAEQQVEISAEAQQSAPVAAGVVPAGTAVPVWGWWTAAIGLVAVAGAMGVIVARQRRALAQAEAPSPNHSS